jgi:hypothetical protein
MNIKLISFIAAALFLILFISSCSNNENSVNSPNSTTLFSTTFEENGYFSAEGWTLPLNSDSSTDIPLNGGKYSLLLNSTSPPEEYAEIKIPVMTQFSDYKLSIWSKSIGVTNGIYGKVLLSLVRADTVVKSQSITITDISWRNYSIEDTFTVAENDSFRIQLSGGVNQIIEGKSYFDLCTLEGIEY